MEQTIIGRGTWLDKTAMRILEREKQLGRKVDLFKVESGLGASGIPHVGSLSDGARAYGMKLALEASGHKAPTWLLPMIGMASEEFRQDFQNLWRSILVILLTRFQIPSIVIVAMENT